jgi:N6-adenosine-specific RNA methylase IME4
VIPLPTVPGGFGCVVADPPWSFNDKGSRMAPERAANEALRYETQPDAWIPALPVARVVAPRAHLYLWTTDAHCDLAFDVVRAWGFSFVQFLEWEKNTFGGGHYFRHVFELCLFATRGALGVPRHDMPAIPARFKAKAGGHSRKPECLQDVAEIMSPGPRLELFARRPRAGWTVYGNQVAKEIPT